jgi:hypothetical protein
MPAAFGARVAAGSGRSWARGIGEFPRIVENLLTIYRIAS